MHGVIRGVFCMFAAIDLVINGVRSRKYRSRCSPSINTDSHLCGYGSRGLSWSAPPTLC